MSTNSHSSKKTSEPWEQAYRHKLLAPDQLAEKAKALRAEGHTLATLNGSFDLLHAGHLHILYEASKAADVLIVALNSDASIRAYKSTSRPLVALAYRLQMVAALGFVDYVTWFEEIDPCALLQKIRPDVHVNGAPYGEQCIEAQTVQKVGGRLHLVEPVYGLSTSTIIEKARRCD